MDESFELAVSTSLSLAISLAELKTSAAPLGKLIDAVMAEAQARLDAGAKQIAANSLTSEEAAELATSTRKAVAEDDAHLFSQIQEYVLQLRTALSTLDEANTA